MFVLTFEILMVIGLIMCVLCWIMLLLCKIIQRVWAWTDDAPPPNINWLSMIINTKLFNNRLIKKSLDKPYVDPDGEMNDGVGQLIGFSLMLIFVPITVYIFMKLIYLSITVLILFALAHLTRFVKRINKKYKFHVSDPNAHQDINKEEDNK